MVKREIIVEEEEILPLPKFYREVPKFEPVEIKQTFTQILREEKT